MKKLRIIYSMIVSMALFFAISLTACADFGPKPYISITFSNAGGERFYSTMLARGDYLPPGWSKFTAEDFDTEEFLELTPEMQDAVRTFADYNAPEDYNYFGVRRTWDSSNNPIEWTYMPPDDFVVLVYFPESGRVLESPVCSAYAFESRFTADLSGAGISMEPEQSLEVVPSYQVGSWLLEFAVRVIITIAIELVVALIFGYWEKRTLLFFAVVNVATQVLLNLILSLVNFRYGIINFLFAYFLGELIVVIFETVFYGLRIGKYSKRKGAVRAVFYAIAANAASLAAGAIFSVNFA